MNLTALQVIDFRSKHKPYESDDIRILLNGVECMDVIHANEEEGYIVRAMVNDEGEYFCIGDEVATEKMTGSVRIELPSWWP